MAELSRPTAKRHRPPDPAADAVESDLVYWLTCVASVTRNSALPSPLVDLIEAFVDPSTLWTLEEASKAASVRLLDRLRRNKHPALPLVLQRERHVIAMSRAAKAGSLAVLDWWLASYLRLPQTRPMARIARKIFRYGAESGHLNVIQWLQQKELLALVPSDKYFDCDHPQAISWLQDQAVPIRLLIPMVPLVERGDLEFINWIHERNDRNLRVHEWKQASYLAAHSGKLDIVQWIQANRPELFGARLIKGAIKGGQLNIAKWLHAQGLKGQDVRVHCDESREIVLHGRRPRPLSGEMVRWLFSTLDWKSENHRKKGIEYAMFSASSHGDLDSLKWLAELQPLLNQRYLLINALIHGHVEIAEWFWSRGLRGGPHAWIAAAESGSVSALQWLQEFEPEAYESSSAADNAVRCGHLDVLRWLHTTRSARFNDKMFMAIWVGCLPIVEYIHENERLSAWRTSNETQTAAIHGHLHIIKWLHQKGLHSRMNLDLIASEGRLPIAKYLMKHLGLRFTAAGVINAAKHKRFALVEWILRHDPAVMDGEAWPTTFEA